MKHGKKSTKPLRNEIQLVFQSCLDDTPPEFDINSGQLAFPDIGWFVPSHFLKTHMSYQACHASRSTTLIEANVFQHVFPELNTEFAVRHVATSDTLQYISSNLDHDFHLRRHTNGSIAPSMKFTSGERKRSDFHCNHQRNLSTEVEVARETMQQKSTIDSRTFYGQAYHRKFPNHHAMYITMTSSCAARGTWKTFEPFFQQPFALSSYISSGSCAPIEISSPNSKIYHNPCFK